MQPWTQNYNPLGNTVLSTLVAALPVACLFLLLAVFKVKAHWSAVYAFLLAAVLAFTVFGMPAQMILAATGTGLVYAVVYIAWILLAAVFVYDLTVESGHFEVIKGSIGGLTDDRRMQVLLIAFAFGAVLEGSGGGGAPVAVTGAMLIGLGYRPYEAAIICLIANTAPVAYGGMGNPIRTLVAVTGLAEADVSAMVGRILPPIAAIIPFWLVKRMATWKETFAVWPGLLVAGLSFAAMQFFWSNFMDASLVDIVGGMGTLFAVAVFLKVWQPKPVWRFPEERDQSIAAKHNYTGAQILHAWSPFLLLAIFVVVWGLPTVKAFLATTSLKFPTPGLHNLVQRTPPVVAAAMTEPAIVDFAWLASVGTGTFLAGLIAGPILGLSFGRTLRVFFRSFYRLRFSLLAIMAMICLGYLTRYCGMDAVMGLAMTNTGVFYTIFGTMIGWLGVALTGTDAGSNALFGSLQVITANKLGLSPVLMAAANTAGGVMGKMIGAQSIIVACVATGLEGREGDMFRTVAKHSIFLALLVGLVVSFFAYVTPQFIPNGHKFW